MSPTASSSAAFRAILERFKRRHGDVHAHVATGTSPEILAWVRNGPLRCRLCMLPQAHPGLVLRPLWNDRFVGLSAPCHALAGRRVPLEVFAAERQIVIHSSTLSHQMLIAAYQAAGLSLVPDMQFDNFHLIAEFVAAAWASALLGDGRAALSEGRRVARVRLPGIDRLTRRLGLVLHADRAMQGPLAALVEEIDRALRRDASKRRTSARGSR